MNSSPEMPIRQKESKDRKTGIWKFVGSNSARAIQDKNPSTVVPKGFTDFESEDEQQVELSRNSMPTARSTPSRQNSFSSSKKTQYEEDGYPPAGYLYIWMGVIRRWHRSFFLLETPGVLTHSKHKGSKMRGALCLRDCRVVPSNQHADEFCIIGPAGVAYLRTMRRDQRGQWISHLRSSIEKYTQCVIETEKGSRGGISGYPVEPEEAKLAKEVKNRLHVMMSQLLPHQAALKWQLNQVVRRARDPLEEPATPARRRPTPDTSAIRLARLSNLNRKSPREKPEKGRSSFDIEAAPSSPHVRPHSSTASVRDDLKVRTCSSLDINGLRARAKMRKSQTPHPVGGCKWTAPRQSSRRNSTSTRQTTTATTPGRRSVDNPFRTNSQTEGVDSGLWQSYQAFIEAVQRVVQKEIQKSIELEVENVALRRLLQMNRYESAAKEASPKRSLSGTTSLSTVESDFDASLLESDEESPKSSRETTSKVIRAIPVATEQLIDAIEVVRRADYVTRNSGKIENIVVTSQSEAPPTDLEEYSPIDNEDSMDIDYFEPRTRLPAPRPMKRGFSLWSILKNAIGRDLTKITLPPTINEPLSALQRLSEEFEHSSYLTSAALCSNPHQRLLYITAFVLSSYNSALPRDCKPFNPLLGETFEYCTNQMRFVAEQVSHHPPVSCFNVQGLDDEGSILYEVNGEFELKSKFWGTTVNVFPVGRMELYLTTTNERYVWNKAALSIHNLVMGQVWLDFYGDIQIKNIDTGDYAKVKLIKARGYGLDRGTLEGKILDSSKKEVYSIDGNYSKVIYARKYPHNNRDEIFRAADLPNNSEEQYNMTPFAVGLNDLDGLEEEELPRTDSRFRPDVRNLENGDLALASEEKLRLEEKQRNMRKARKANGQKYVPMWFNLRKPDVRDISKAVEQDQDLVWKFREEYWERKEMGNWGGCPDIY